jgi:Uncharacterised protein family (UPF0182)
VIGRRRGRALLTGAVVLAVLLVAGRWLAVETAERAWAATLPAGNVYLEGRALARLARLAVWLLATLWGTGNLYIVYRAIGSVQMPRRVGNLEIVEAVPQPVLLALAVGSGLLFGFGLAWGTGEWWLRALLAGGAPHFGITDPLLHKDLGYYVGVLPWALDRQQFFLLSTVTIAVLVAFLYLAIGSLRWHQGRVVASAHARAHVGILLAGVAAGVLWGALLDPAEIVAGMHGTVGGGLVSVRLPGAPYVAASAALAALASLAWAGWDRPRLLAAGWTVLGLALIGVYGILPAMARTGPEGGAYTEERQTLTALALGTEARPVPDVAPYASLERFLAAMPLWSPNRVAAVAVRYLSSDEAVSGVTLTRTTEGRPLWIVARAPDETSLATTQPPPDWARVHRRTWASAGGPLGLVETDSGLRLEPLAVPDSGTWFGAGFMQYAVRNAATGIPLDGLWRRVALAWVLQSPEIARNTLPGDRLLWRRAAAERFSRLAPFADFATPEPVIADGALWWLALGYVSAEAFPLVEPVDSPYGSVSYLRAGLVGAMRATTGETRFWLLPGADSLSSAWARLFAPLVAPADSLPGPLVAALPFPAATFALAARQRIAATPDSDRWRGAAREPFAIGAPAGDSTWLAQAFVSPAEHRVEGFLLGRTGAQGPELLFARPPAPDPPPQLLVGAGDTVPGPLRLWAAAGHLASVQARFIAPRGEAPRLERVFVTWGNREGEGRTARAALADLAAGGLPGMVDTSLTGRWTQVRALFAELDAALAERDFDRFARVYRQLGELLGLRRGVLAPAPPPH